jgi:hypothetical protein
MPTQIDKSIAWEPSLEGAQQHAVVAGMPLLIDFSAAPH